MEKLVSGWIAKEPENAGMRASGDICLNGNIFKSSAGRTAKMVGVVGQRTLWPGKEHIPSLGMVQISVLVVQHNSEQK